MHLVSNAGRIGADDVLSKIDAPVDLAVVFANMQARVGCSGIGPQGYDPLVRFKCLLIRQWHPEARVCALNCGWISCGFAAPTSLHLYPMRRPIDKAVIIGTTLVQSTAPAPATISTRRKTGQKGEAPDDPPPTIQACISVPTRKRGGSGTARSVRWVTKMTSKRLYPPGRGPDEESFIDKVHMGHLRTEPGAPGLIPWSKGRTRGRVLADKACASKTSRDALRGRHLCEWPPVIEPPCGLRNNAGAGGASNTACGVEQCLCHDEAPPDSPGQPKQDIRLALVAIRQNLRGTANRITFNR